MKQHDIVFMAEVLVNDTYNLLQFFVLSELK